MENQKTYCEYELNLTEQKQSELTEYLATNPCGYTLNEHYTTYVDKDNPCKVVHRVHYNNIIHVVVGIVQEIAKNIDYQDRIVIKLSSLTKCPSKSLWIRMGSRPDCNVPFAVLNFGSSTKTVELSF